MATSEAQVPCEYGAHWTDYASFPCSQTYAPHVDPEFTRKEKH